VARKVQEIQRSNRKRSRPKVPLIETLAAETTNAKLEIKYPTLLNAIIIVNLSQTTKNLSILNPQIPCPPPILQAALCQIITRG
jgi:hypothetical protein